MEKFPCYKYTSCFIAGIVNAGKQQRIFDNMQSKKKLQACNIQRSRGNDLCKQRKFKSRDTVPFSVFGPYRSHFLSKKEPHKQLRMKRKRKGER
jgi:hypothetical protein